MPSLEKTYQIPAFARTVRREMENQQKLIAENIRRVRERRGYDQEPFALMAGISPKQLKRLEEGEVMNPHMKTLRAIAEAGEVPLNEIRPDSEREERKLRAQLDRMEAMLKALTAELRAAKQREAGRERRLAKALADVAAAGRTHPQARGKRGSKPGEESG